MCRGAAPQLALAPADVHAMTAFCSFEDGLRLVKLRGESMQAAADAKPSGMVSVIGLDSAKVAELCAVSAAHRYRRGGGKL